MKIIFLLLVILIIAGLVVTGQHRLIYYPRSYVGKPPLPERGEVLGYNTGQGRQAAFYLPPAGDPGQVPGRLWLMFGGNASLALDWLGLIKDFPDPEAAFLLVDYPGYGRSEGRPGPAAILESAETALLALAAHLGAPPADLERRRFHLLPALKIWPPAWSARFWLGPFSRITTTAPDCGRSSTGNRLRRSPLSTGPVTR
ncbi:MAG: hypothetical protein LC633_00515 [Desulfobulbaceae bacterium]|nr:hypothetical protein [Desulfobulbaceae bacterium]